MDADSSQESVTAYSNQELLDAWYRELDMTARDTLYKALKDRKLFPTDATNTWETEAGLYPDTQDPAFIHKIMMKQEFAENLQESLGVQQRNKKNPCDSNEEFEISPVQRFIARFLSPQTPYASALLYHGVGVGKTCAAINTAEEHLRAYPKEYVYIIAPRNIQPGFRRTIFDEETLVIPKEDDLSNTATGCTGNSYLVRTGMELERNRDLVIRRIKQSINIRYKILGYTQFYNYIQGILKRSEKIPDKERRTQEQIRDLRNEFDGKMLIIDEAHNLRDSPGETEEENLDIAGGDNELSESTAGKRLTPKLMNVLRVAQGMKLLLLTGTPMYNNYNEIIFLMNLLLINDKRAEISEKDIFMPKLKMVPGKGLTVFRPGGKEKLGNITSAYLSFMRGENPLSFPIRFNPQDAACPKLEAWPTISPVGEDITQKLIPGLLRLPFVPVTYEPDELRVIKAIADTVTERAGLSLRSLDEMIQSGNWLYPGDTPEGRIRDAGFDSIFQEKKEGSISRFEPREDPSWMARANLKRVSPKAHFIINRIPDTKGVIFVYSRFIKSGALPLALCLEANGYTPYGQDKTLFTNGPIDGQGRQCALCSRRERTHAGENHRFVPAKYVLLTGQINLSPNNAASIKAARSESNIYGKDIKVVIGSQVASEGIDLRFIREIYVFDAWYHLNKMEQVLGRGVRTCSHALLPAAERNCTIHLLTNTYGDNSETADLYMYRQGMKKAVEMGEVTRTLKESALDCNLNFPAIYAKDMDPIDRMEDSRSEIREDVSLNDTPYSSICDWMECPYACSKVVNIESLQKRHALDVSTYDEYAMRWRESQMKQIIRDIFEKTGQPIIQSGSLEDIFIDKDIPAVAIKTLLTNIIDNKSFRIRVNSQEGYITYRNGFYLFQPIRLADVRIPLALRVASVPVRRDAYVPAKITTTTLGQQAPAPAEATEAAAVETTAAVAPPSSGVEYWKACVTWAQSMITTTSPLDIPDEVIAAIDKRYSGDKYKREYNVLSMISWMYEHIKNSGTYDAEKQTKYLNVLFEVFLEIIWDESLSHSEQAMILAAARDPIVEAVSIEQRVKKGSTEAFRYISTETGAIKYDCGGSPCSEAVVRLFETDKTDPYNGLQVNKTTTGPIYGFIIPKLKESKFVLKTSDRVVDAGQELEKGKECENISKIADHKEQLKQIRTMIVALGLPPFLIIDAVLNEKEERSLRQREEKKKKKKEDMTAAEREVMKMKEKLIDSFRKFQNVIKACTLKNITLRMVDKLEKELGGKRYFYRPISAVKSKHKLK
jgi:hypothetical protein